MFGRRKNDEDPFAALQDGATYHSDPTTIAASPPPVPTTSGAWPATPSSTNLTPSKPRRRGSSGPSLRWMVWFIAPIVIGVIAVLAVVASSTTSSPVNDLAGADAGPTTPAHQSSVGGGTVSHTTKPPAPPSYLTTAGVRAALARVQRLAPGSRPVELRIDPKSFVAIVQLPNHSVKLINITPTGSFSAPAGQTGEKPIPVSKINPVVPGRIVAEMNHRFHVPLSRIEYLVAFWFPGFTPEWQVFLKGTHTAYLATLSGAQLHRSA